MATTLPLAPFGLGLWTGNGSSVMGANTGTRPLTQASNFYRGTLISLTTDKVIPTVIASNTLPILGVTNLIHSKQVQDIFFQDSHLWLANTPIVTGTTPTATYLLSDLVYVAQLNGTIAAANIGQFCDMEDGGGDSATGNSTQAIQAGAFVATSTTKQLQVIGILPTSIDTDGTYKINPYLMVKINAARALSA